ncbi:hypothetical protein RB195_023724 [Necator americanus]|uniref:Kazal-like domain-containing protein n=1 Tax=Necator americanus TaxID=51031 RepID=A0ABR1EKH0_NECAM
MHPERCEGNALGSIAVEEVCLCICGNKTSTYNSVCAARSAADFSQEKRLRRKLRRQQQQDRDNEWTSKAKKFEKVWKEKNPRKTRFTKTV